MPLTPDDEMLPNNLAEQNARDSIFIAQFFTAIDDGGTDEASQLALLFHLHATEERIKKAEGDRHHIYVTALRTINTLRERLAQQKTHPGEGERMIQFLRAQVSALKAQLAEAHTSQTTSNSDSSPATPFTR